MLNLEFPDTVKEEKYKIYKDDIKKSLYEYGDSIQNMDLEESDAYEKIINLLAPDPCILINKSKLNSANYYHEKIRLYLSNSDERSVSIAMSKLIKYGYKRCSDCGVCVNSEWGVIQLVCIKEELDPYFPIDLDATDKELFFQYCAAVYFANKSSEVKK